MNPRIRPSVQAMRGYVPGEQPDTDPFIKLNTNENPYPPSPLVEAVLRRWDAAALRLYPDPSSRRLREAVAALHGCSPEQVLVGNGSDELLALCTRAFVEDDGVIGYLDPTYGLYPVLAQIRHVAERACPLGPDFEWGAPDPHVDLFFLANPNSPTGTRFPRAEIEAFCRQVSGVVVLDEAYADFASEHAMDLALASPNVIVVRTLSKSYSLAGLRVGYAVGPKDLIEALMKIKDSYNLDRLAQEIALAALQDQDHMRRNVERIRTTRDRVAEALTRLGCHVGPSETNFLWVRPPRWPAKEWLERLRQRRILVRHFPGPRTEAYLRITMGTDEQMDQLLQAVRAILTEV